MKQRHSIRRFSIGMWTIALTLLATVFAYGTSKFGSILINAGSLKLTERANVPNGDDVKASGAAVLWVPTSDHKLHLSNNNATGGVVQTDEANSIPDGALSTNVALLNRASQTFTGDPQIFNHVQTATGSAGSPAYAFSGDTGTGIYQTGAGDLSIGISGGRKWAFNTTVFTPVANVTQHLGTAGSLFLLDVSTARQITGGLTPTASSTGTGTGPTNTIDTGSSDLGGTITVTAGTAPGNSGTLTVTFSTGTAYGTNAPPCVAMLGNGTGTWNARATAIGGTMSTTAAIFNWDNNAVNLTASSTYKFHYHCLGK